MYIYSNQSQLSDIHNLQVFLRLNLCNIGSTYMNVFTQQRTFYEQLQQNTSKTGLPTDRLIIAIGVSYIVWNQAMYFTKFTQCIPNRRSATFQDNFFSLISYVSQYTNIALVLRLLLSYSKKACVGCLTVISRQFVDRMIIF